MSNNRLSVGLAIGTLAIFLFLLGWAGGILVPQTVFGAKEEGKVTKPLEKAFPHSDKCKRCHLRVFEEWEASAQSRSIVTAAFRVTLERFLASADKKDATMCFRCHAPHVLEYGHQGGHVH